MCSSMAVKSGGPCTFGPPLPESGGQDPSPPPTGSPLLLLSYHIPARSFSTLLQHQSVVRSPGSQFTQPLLLAVSASLPPQSGYDMNIEQSQNYR